MALTGRIQCYSCALMQRLISRNFCVSHRVFNDQQFGEQKTQTHFGFEAVSEEEKEEKVYEVFHNVAEKYDVMNDAMSGGVHRLWKDYFVERLAPVPGTKLLDVAGGTGDIAFRFLKFVNYEQKHDDTSDLDIEMPKSITMEMYGDVELASDSDDDEDFDTMDYSDVQSHVTVCDINHAMLDVGQKKAKNLGIHYGISWVQGNAESLPISDDTYDAYTIAFGIRNCTHIDKVLSEAYRVLKPGGRFMCLEFSQVNNAVLQQLYDSYSFQVIPVMGQVIAGDWKSYQYLVESIRQFPPQDEFADMIKEAGFRFVKYENLMFGVAAIHTGFKL